MLSVPKPGHPLVEDSFAPLRAEADKLRDSLGKLREALDGGTPGGKGTGGKKTNTSAGQGSRIQDVRDFISALDGIEKTLKGLGGLAKAMGLDATVKQLDRVADQVQAIDRIGKGLGATFSAFRPALAPVVALLGTALIAQQAFNLAAGKGVKSFSTLLVQIGSAANNLPGNFDKFRAQAKLGRVEQLQRLVEERRVAAAEAQRVPSFFDPIGTGAADSLKAAEEALQGAKEELAEFTKEGEKAKTVTQLLEEGFAAMSGEAEKLANALRVRDLLLPDSVAAAQKRLTDLRSEAVRSLKGTDPSARGQVLDAAKAQEIAKVAESISKLRTEQALLQTSSASTDAPDQKKALVDRVELIRQEIEATEALGQARVAALDLQTPIGQFKARLTEMGDLTTQTFDFIEDGIKALAATISAAIIDAFFEPQKSIRETFGNLFKALSQQLLQIIIQATIARAISGAFSTGGQVGGTGQVQGKATGGRIWSHANAPGFAGGGGFFARPSWISARDTVAAWLEPGEWVHRVAAVRTYGEKFMRAVNEQRIDPNAARFLADQAGGGSSAAPTSGAFATGGSVGGGSGSGVASAQQILVTNEQTAAQIYAGGVESLLKMMSRNKGRFRAALG